MSDRIYTHVSRMGDSIIERGVDLDGKTYQIETLYEPALYTHTHRDSDFKGLVGEDLQKIQFNTPTEMKEYIDRYTGVEGHSIYGSRDVVAQYISDTHEDKVFDMSVIKGNILDIEVFSGHFDANTSEWVFDGFPVPELANKPINSLTFYDTALKVYRVYGLEVLDGVKIGSFNNTHSDVIYNGYDNEKSLLNAFLSDFANADFHFISGWYVELFDIAYLTNRIINVLGKKDANLLSPLRKVRQKTIRGSYGKDNETYKFLGMATLDYIDLYKKLDVGYKPKNWKLNTVASDKLGDTKVAYDGPLQELYLKDFQSFIEYNIHDVRLIVNMENSNRFFDLIFTIAHMMKSNVEDSFATVKPWSNLMYHSLKAKNTFPKLRGVSTLDYPYPGGFVKDPKLGLSKWVVSFDLNSLYPHIMQQYNLGQETLIEYKDLPQELKDISKLFFIDRDVYYDMEKVQTKLNENVDHFINKTYDLSCLKKYGYGLSASGMFFSNKDESVFNGKTKEIYNMRVQARKQLSELKKSGSTDKALMSQLQNKQLALKLMMNSLYGAVANAYFTEYFDIRVAEAITSSGQRAIKFVSARLNTHLNKVCNTVGKDYVVANDTDSCYIVLDDLVKMIFKESAEDKEYLPKIVDFLDKVGEQKLQVVINEAFNELADYTNAREQRMFMKREAIAVSAIWTAKKRYTMLLADLEGERFLPYKVKYTGLEALRSDYPAVCQDALVECYSALLNESGVKEVKRIVKRFKSEFDCLPLDKITSSKSANNIPKFVDDNGNAIKGTPNHIKAAISYNNLIRRHNLDKLRPFNEGDKVQVVPLKRNPYGINEIAFDSKLPTELGLDNYVDRESLFEKTFLSPLETICEVCGISKISQTNKINSLF